MNPKEAPCKLNSDTAAIPATLNNFRSWKNSGNGVYMEKIGDVRLNGFLLADNLKANIEIA